MKLTWIQDGALAASGMISASDPALLREHGITAVLSLTVRSPFPEGAPDGLAHLHLPVPDMTCPPPEDLERAVRFLVEAIDAGGRALVHCGAGYGRTGTVLACYLVSRGLGPREAMAAVRRARPGAIETAEQERGVLEHARRAGRNEDG